MGAHNRCSHRGPTWWSYGLEILLTILDRIEANLSFKPKKRPFHHNTTVNLKNLLLQSNRTFLVIWFKRKEKRKIELNYWKIVTFQKQHNTSWRFEQIIICFLIEHLTGVAYNWFSCTLVNVHSTHYTEQKVFAVYFKNSPFDKHC